MKRYVSIVGLALTSMVMHAGVQAAPITLSWSDTVAVDSVLPAGTFIGDPFTFTFTVDNGGSSVINQSWDTGDFVSAAIDVGGGVYTATIPTIDLSYSSGFFNTATSGTVDGTGSWYSPSGTNDVTDLWFGIYGFNPFWGMWDAQGDPLLLINASNVADNQTPDNWIASPAVPEPTSIFLVGIGAFGLFGYRWCKRKSVV